MDLTEAQALANWLMFVEHDMPDEWSFRFDSSKTRFGVCSYRDSEIRLSMALTAQTDAAEVRNTILHEIAHFLCWSRFGIRGHGAQWRAIALAIGCDGQRCHQERVAGDVLGSCDCAADKHNRHRMPRQGYVYRCRACQTLIRWYRVGTDVPEHAGSGIVLDEMEGVD